MCRCVFAGRENLYWRPDEARAAMGFARPGAPRVLCRLALNKWSRASVRAGVRPTVGALQNPIRFSLLRSFPKEKEKQTQGR